MGYKAIADYDTVASIKSRMRKVVMSARFRFQKREQHTQAWFPRDLVTHVGMKYGDVKVERRLVGSPDARENKIVIRKALKYVLFKSVTVKLERSKEKAVDECVGTVEAYIEHKAKDFMRSKRVQRIRADEERKRDRKDALNSLESSIRDLLSRYEHLKEAEVVQAYRRARNKDTVDKVLKA